MCYNVQEKKYEHSSISTALDKYIACKQTEGMNDQQYLDKYNDAVKAFKNVGIFFNVTEQLVKQEHGDILTKNDQ